MATFDNEKRLQRLFGLRHRPARFAHRETAVSFARHGVKYADVVLFLGDNPDGLISGFYVVCPADFARLEREADGLFKYVRF